MLADAGLAVRRLRRLGRAADRRVHRQGRQGHPAGRRRRRRRPQLLPQHARRGAGHLRARAALFDDVRPASGWGAQRRRAARRADAAVGVRHRGRRPDHRHQPVRPARRRERQGGRPRDARRRRRRARRRAFADGPVTVYASEGWLPDGVDTVADAVAALLDAARPRATATSPCRPTSTGTATPPLADVRDAPRRRAPAGRSPSAGDRGSCTPPGSTTRADPPTGVYLQVTGQPEADLAVPDRPFTFHEFLTAQAVGDGQVLAEQGPARAAPAPRRPGRPGRRTAGARVTSGRLDQPAAGPARTAGCPGSPGRAGWCCSASPATCRARR